MYYRGKGFHAVVWLAPSPAFDPPPVQVVSLSLPVCFRSSVVTEMRGWGGGAKSYDPDTAKKPGLLQYIKYSRVSTLHKGDAWQKMVFLAEEYADGCSYVAICRILCILIMLAEKR